MELIFASHNENKVSEIRAMLPDFVELKSLNDIGYHTEIDETGTTLEENSKIKAETIYKLTGKNVFADDTGLFVDALDGAPGVFSSRYAGTGNSEDNIIKLLEELEGKENRNAHFKTVICLIINGKSHFLEGRVDGIILKGKRGDDGFGYDPVFLPENHELSFAEMDLNQKNKISHRYKAIQKLLDFIANLD